MTKTCACGATLSPKNKTGRCHPCAVLAAPKSQPRPVPADFAVHAARENNTDLSDRYGCSTDIITRWRKETGTPAPSAKRGGMAQQVPTGFRLAARDLNMTDLKARYGVSEGTIKHWCRELGIPVPKPFHAVGSSTRHFNPVTRPSRDTSRAGLAADFLKRFGRVVRCDADGRINPNGTHWLRGNSVPLTADEIIARAVRNGWREHAWKELAAA